MAHGDAQVGVAELRRDHRCRHAAHGEPDPSGARQRSTLGLQRAGRHAALAVHPNRPKDQFTLDYNKCQADTLRDPKLQQGIQLLIIQATERCVQKQ